MKPDLLKKQIKMGIAIYPARFPAKRSTQGCLWHACLWSLPGSGSQKSAEWLWNTNKVASLIAEEQHDYLKKLVNIHMRYPSCHCNTFYLPRAPRVNSFRACYCFQWSTEWGGKGELRGGQGEEPWMGIAHWQSHPHWHLLLTSIQSSKRDARALPRDAFDPKSLQKKRALWHYTRCFGCPIHLKYWIRE